MNNRRVVFVAHDDNPFFAPVKSAFLTFAKDRSWAARFVAPVSFDAGETARLQAEVLLERPDGVILTRVDDSVEFDQNILMALAQGTRVILCNVAGENYRHLDVAFVGQALQPAGAVNGELAIRHGSRITGRSSGVIVGGNPAPGNVAYELRLAGMAEAIAEYNAHYGTGFRLDPIETSKSRDLAWLALEQKWQKDGDEIVAWAMCDFTSCYVADWASESDLEGRFAIGGFDLLEPVVQAIANGTVHWTLGQHPYAQGWVAAALLSLEMEAGIRARNYDTGVEIVEASNLVEIRERLSRSGG